MTANSEAPLARLLAADAPLDAYYVWARLTGFAGFPVADGQRVPLIFERPDAVSDRSALREQLVGLGAQPTHALKDPRFERWRIPFDALNHAVDALVGARVRWEMGLAMANPDGILPGLGGDSGIKPSFMPSTVIGIIDYGCAFAHRQFQRWTLNRRVQGTRVRALWDQSDWRAERVAEKEKVPFPFQNLPGNNSPSRKPPKLDWRFPTPFGYGREVGRAPQENKISGVSLPIPIPFFRPDTVGLDEYLKHFLNDRYLDEEACYRHSGYEASQVPYSHGTHVMDVAAGHPDPRYAQDSEPAVGAAHDILFVQLPRTQSGSQISGLLRCHVLDAVEYLVQRCTRNERLVVNLSYGSSAGPHDGSSLFELALDEIIEDRRRFGPQMDMEVVIPAGNWGDAPLHASATLGGSASHTFTWANPPDNPMEQFVEFWIDGDGAHQVELSVTSPSNVTMTVVAGSGETTLVGTPQAIEAALVAPRRPSHGATGLMILLAVAPTLGRTHRASADYGQWQLKMTNRADAASTVNAWCERADPVFGSNAAPRQAYFTSPADFMRTLNSIAHGRNTVVVGGSDAQGRLVAFSSSGPGRGETRWRHHVAATQDAKTGPEVAARCMHSDESPWVFAAGMLSSERIGLTGTSIAAAAATRWIAANPQWRQDLPKLDRTNPPRPHEPENPAEDNELRKPGPGESPPREMVPILGPISI